MECIKKPSVHKNVRFLELIEFSDSYLLSFDFNNMFS